MAGSWLFKDFTAVYLTIGAVNELSTATAYGALSRKSGHPVLKDLLARITKDERRHFAFYFNSAKDWPEDNVRGQKLDRLMLDRLCVPAGQRVTTPEAVATLAHPLFDDEHGQEGVMRREEESLEL